MISLIRHPSTPGQGNRTGLAHRLVVYRFSLIGVVAGRDVPPCSCEGERLAAQLGSARLRRRRRRGRRTSARRQSPMRFHVPRQAGELAGLAVAGLAQLRGQPHGVALPQSRRLRCHLTRDIHLAYREPGHHVVDRLKLHIGSAHRWPPIGSSGFPRSGSLPQASRDQADGVIVQTGLSDASLVAPAVEGWRQGGTMRAHRCGKTPDTMRSAEMRKHRSETLPKPCRKGRGCPALFHPGMTERQATAAQGHRQARCQDDQ